MSKAVLVIDMPENCVDCNLLKGDGISSLHECSATGELVGGHNKDSEFFFGRPKECPLHELPQKITSWKGKSTNYQQGHRDGYNACIDEILKGCD